MTAIEFHLEKDAETGNSSPFYEMNTKYPPPHIGETVMLPHTEKIGDEFYGKVIDVSWSYCDEFDSLSYMIIVRPG